MSQHRPGVVSSAMALAGVVVAFLTSGRVEVPRWAAITLLAVLGLLLALVTHFYFGGGG